MSISTQFNDKINEKLLITHEISNEQSEPKRYSKQSVINVVLLLLPLSTSISMYIQLSGKSKATVNVNVSPNQ